MDRSDPIASGPIASAPRCPRPAPGPPDSASPPWWAERGGGVSEGIEMEGGVSLSGRRGPAPEARQKVGPGVRPGSSIPARPEPQRGDRMQPFLLRWWIGSCGSACSHNRAAVGIRVWRGLGDHNPPTPHAVGYRLSALRAWSRGAEVRRRSSPPSALSAARREKTPVPCAAPWGIDRDVGMSLEPQSATLLGFA